MRRLHPGLGYPFLLFLPLLSFVLGFGPGADMGSEEARRVAESEPEVREILSHPTVESSADYDSKSDSWRVFFKEDATGTAVARVVVADDAQEVSEVDIFPVADTLRYPETSESEAIKLALADPEVREELTRHGPYTTDAEYSEGDGEWTVHVEVDEEG